MFQRCKTWLWSGSCGSTRCSNKAQDRSDSWYYGVFTATSDDETALAYKDKRHGMFTYFLLDHLKKTRGNASFGEMFQVLSTHVKKNSMLENDKLQTPSVNVSASMKPKWKKLQF
nr:caspase family protein [uncultured Duncaniella sp.]